MLITTSMMAVSVSTRSAQSNVNVPDWTHLNTGTTVGSYVPPTKPRKMGQLSAAPMESAPVVIAFANTLGADLLVNPATIAAISGRKTMMSIECTVAYPLSRSTSSTAMVPRPRK